MPLKAQVQSELARRVLARREGDKRYQSAAKANARGGAQAGHIGRAGAGGDEAPHPHDQRGLTMGVIDTAGRAVEMPDRAPAEQALIGHAMIKPHLIGEIAAALDLNAIAEPLHRRVLEVLFQLHSEGRTPGLASIIVVMGNEEIAPQVTLRDYMRRIMSEVFVGGLASWRDAVEVVHEGTRRIALHDIGSALAAAAIGGKV